MIILTYVKEKYLLSIIFTMAKSSWQRQKGNFNNSGDVFREGTKTN